MKPTAPARWFLLFALTIVFIPPAWGQAVKGQVTDQERRGIEGAQVRLQGSDSHTHTARNGIFSLPGVSPGDTLEITSLGFEPAVAVIGDITQPLVVRLAEKVITLDEVVISPDEQGINVFADIDLKTNPVNSSQEILRRVPGLVIGQHAGGGKAEQIFLRGFDIDHGTDILLSVDGMPVNMVSHAHGQGYADLHFLIPETIEQLDFGKGPYYAAQGNFATAGYAAFQTKERLTHSEVKVEGGQFNSQRLLGMFSLADNEHSHAYLATEYVATDGPFESPQHFNRLNMMAKFTANLPGHDKLSVSTAHFTSRWDASGQIPQRAVDNGSISRFGAIDDTEGGNTSRTHVSINHVHNLANNAYMASTVYYAAYDFELFSNFTFFLNDPVNGDQIRQAENRSLFGVKSEYNQVLSLGKVTGNWQLGLGLRHDESRDNGLYRTVNRITPLDTVQLGDILETNAFAYLSSDFQVGKWFINPSLRVDQFSFAYDDRLQGFYGLQSETKVALSPKLNVMFNPSNVIQLYAKGGRGFHSNDARVVVAQQGREILPAAWGTDLGAIWKPGPRVLLNAAWWYLFLEQEFVYVGDEGIVEPSGQTRRSGVDISMRYQPVRWLFTDVDVNYTLARAVGEPEGSNYIPLAPQLTVMAGLNVIHPMGLYGGLRVRYLGDRPANEDNSIVAEGYHVVDLNAGYKWGKFDLGINVQNLFNVAWNETQFATESRLRFEPEAVEEIHFTPGTPLFVKGSLAYRF